VAARLKLPWRTTARKTDISAVSGLISKSYGLFNVLRDYRHAAVRRTMAAMSHALTQPNRPVALGRTSIVHLPAGLDVGMLTVDDSYWSHATDQPELGDGRIMSVFEYAETWTWWERHPTGDELLYVLSGQIDLLLDRGSGPRTVRVHADESVIVPTGTWHRAVISEPSRLLFVTPTPALTEHRPV